MAADKDKRPGKGPKASGAGGPKKGVKHASVSGKAADGNAAGAKAAAKDASGTKTRPDAAVAKAGAPEKEDAAPKQPAAPPKEKPAVAKGGVKGGKGKGKKERPKHGASDMRRSSESDPSGKGGKKEKKDQNVIEENLGSLADGIIQSKIDTKNNMDVKDIVSEDLYNPAGKDTVEYGEYKTFDFSHVEKEFSIDTIKTIEIDHEKNVKVVNLEKVTKVIDIDGHELTAKEEKPEHKRKHLRRKPIDESKLEFDPMDQLKDFKANRNEYRVKCRVCQNSQRCQVCLGSGRRFILFKCRNCTGTGKCPDCAKTYGVKCRHCKEDVINYSPRCLECGKEYHCPICQSLLPISATKCIKCRTEFICRRCKLPVAPGMERRCPRCNAKVEQALY